ncbi:hypothetical protein ADL09_27030 [Streptomyces sp. NRRL F-7442]|nr:hypothetical protein ADL09_27030 [Streptomyces sp. NRRL F-7442]
MQAAFQGFAGRAERAVPGQGFERDTEPLCARNGAWRWCWGDHRGTRGPERNALHTDASARPHTGSRGPTGRTPPVHLVTGAAM